LVGPQDDPPPPPVPAPALYVGAPKYELEVLKFGDAALAKNKYDQLKGLLSLDNIKYLKGTGAISDAEQRLLANAASALGRNLGNEQARQVLTQLRDDLTALQGQGGQSQGGEMFCFL